MGFTALDLILLSLATWRLSHMLSAEDGPFDIFHTMRSIWPGRILFTCIYCTSVWAAILLVGIHLLTPILSWWLAISGAAMMLRSYTGAGMRSDDKP